MQNVTSFSASLLQALGNDTDKAADVADMAMIDMADNANKMGTAMDSIQHAYQGFAKQNYTMLDNLKLGYGGTKTEMERLLKDAGQIYRYMHPLMRDLNYEECWALLLNNNARLIKRVKLSQGGRTETLVDVRILLKHALLAEATSMILVHNHPSGSCRPSKEDIRLTEHVKTAGMTMNIKLLDHVIVTDGDYYSFSEDGKL